MEASFRALSGNTGDGLRRLDSPAPISSLSKDVGSSDYQVQTASETVPRSLRIACLMCRRKKLRCDSGQPSCATCLKLGHDCNYVESRKKSGPRRGYVKTLETRLAQVEALLIKQDTTEPSPITSAEGPPNSFNTSTLSQYPEYGITNAVNPPSINLFPDFIQAQTHAHLFPAIPAPDLHDPPPNDLYDGMSWALIELGLEEPLPLQDTIDDLTDIYFTKVHPSYPFIYESRFRADMNLSPHTRPSVSLRYAMWANAASTTDRYKELHIHFYARARKYAEADEMSGRHKYINVRHVQAWLLISSYEYKMRHFPHAWLTTGRATRLTQMMSLHRLDGLGMDVKQTMQESADWSEKEERRRTFWMAFIMDRHGSIGTGWPMIIDERDIVTNMPSSEEAYLQNEETPGISFTEAMQPQRASGLSAFAGVVIIAALSGRTLLHLHRPSPKNDDDDLNGEFWKAHRKIDNILLNTSLFLPPHLRLPTGSSNTNIIFLNMGLQAATIVVHHAAIFKAEKFGLAPFIVAESRMRCVAAATQICSIMRMIAHMDLSVLNIYTTFILFLAIRIFAQARKEDPDNDYARSSAHFLLSALAAMKSKVPLAEIYIIQLEMEDVTLAALQENEQTAGLETSVANISIKDDISHPSWDRFVSPLVRIIEQGDDSKNITSKGIPKADDDHGSERVCIGHNNVSGSIGSTLSSSGGNRISDSLGYFPQGQSNLSEVPEFLDDFAGQETWELGDQNISTDLFDTLMDMGPNTWNRMGNE